MTADWLSRLSVNPIPALVDWTDNALAYFTRRDVLQQSVDPVESLWDLPAASRLIRNQRADGSWRYPGKNDPSVPGQNTALLETFRNLRVLVEMFGFTRAHPALVKAADYLFSCQTVEGDIRGIIGNQYMPYYFGAILELLIKAGYADDPGVISGLDWLLSMRQNDGGWIVPTQAVPSAQRTTQFWAGEPVKPERTKPHAHLATGMVLRAFAAHPNYRMRPEILAAACCLKVRLFKADKYNDRQAPAYWLKFQYPFWWTSLVSALDILSILGFTSTDMDIARGLAWFATQQQMDGLWATGYDSGEKAETNRRWVGLAVCRILGRFG